jgi:hypothetical protein
MKILILVFMVVSAFPSCRSSNNMSYSEQNEHSLPKSTFNISPQTQIFINHINAELSEQNSNLSNFIPSNKLLDEYPLFNSEKGFLITGFLQFKESFNSIEDCCQYFSIKVSSSETYRAEIPLKEFDKFLLNESIEYFAISEKSELIKK